MIASLSMAGKLLAVLESGSDSTALLQPAHTLLDDRTTPIRLFVEHFHRQRQALSVSNQVELAAEATSPAARSVVFRLVGGIGRDFFEAPTAAREARTLEPSIHQRSQSILPSRSKRICSAPRIRSKVPSARHRWKYPYTVRHGLNRFGRSRHGAPVRRIHRMPLGIRRRSLGGRPVEAAGGATAR